MWLSILNESFTLFARATALSAVGSAWTLVSSQTVGMSAQFAAIKEPNVNGPSDGGVSTNTRSNPLLKVDCIERQTDGTPNWSLAIRVSWIERASPLGTI